MRKIIVYIATSTDGFIARRNGSVDWLDRPQIKGSYGMGEFYRSIDTVLWGRKTYDMALGFKAGGKAGSIFTNGLRNQHWDAVVEGPTSKNTVRDRRPTFYLYVPDGTDSSDYVLIQLNKKSDHREFQIGSFGGVTGGKSGVKKEKQVAFRAEHIGIRAYKLSLDDALRPGEYAFFMGTGQSTTMSGATGGNRSGGAASGRIYDFSVSQ